MTTNKKIPKHEKSSITAGKTAAEQVSKHVDSVMSPVAKGINRIENQNEELELTVGEMKINLEEVLEGLEEEREETDKKLQEEAAKTRTTVKEDGDKTRTTVKEDGDKTRAVLGEKIDEAGTKINVVAGQLSNLTATVESMTKGNKNSTRLIKALAGERDDLVLLQALVLSLLDKHENEDDSDSDKTVEDIKVLLKDVILPSDCDTGAAMQGFRARLNDGGNAEAVEDMATKVRKEEEAVAASEKLNSKAAKTAASARNTLNTLKNLAKKK